MANTTHFLLALAAGALLCAGAGVLAETAAEARARELGVVRFSCPLDSNRNIINGTYPDPDNCNLYYHCNAGLQWVRQCPPTQNYEPKADALDCYFRMCVNSTQSRCTQNDERAQAKYELVRDELEAQERELRAQMEAESSGNTDTYYPCYRDDNDQWVDITLPNRQNCRQYYHCVGGQSFPSECPPFLYYTPDIGWQGPGSGECRFQACFDLEDAKCAVDGAWGAWGPWEECSAACGDGIQLRRRECNDPPPQNQGSACPGYDFEPRQCNEGPCKDNGTAVFVYRLTDINTGVTEVDPIEFDGVLVNTDGSYSFDENKFTAPVDGYYFHTLGAGVLALQEGHAYVKINNEASMGIRRSHRNHIGRDGGISNQVIISMSQGQSVNVAAAPNTTMTADAGKPSYWTIFNVDELNKGLSVFSAAYSAPSLTPSNPLQFDVVTANEGNHYNPATGMFTPQYPGIYYFSMSAGVDTTSTNRDIDFTMTCSGTCNSTTTIQTKLTRKHNNYQGIDSMSRGVLMKLTVGTNVMVTSANAFHSSDRLQTAFTGFLYEPEIVDDRVAFFVARDAGWADSTALDPVPFNRVVLNEGGGWGAQGLDDYFVAPVTGFYFIFMSAGARSQQRVDIRVYKNDEYVADLYRQSVVHTAEDTMSRNFIIDMQQGDRLRWRAIANTGFESSTVGYETSFGGMLLFRGTTTTAENQQLLEKFNAL